jgi:pimeloyl-ACP methyl ester carboxylesterase
MEHMSRMEEHLQTGLLFEITAVALQGLLLPLGRSKRKIKSVGPGHTRPVVLVHGYGQPSALLPLGLYLQAVGFDRIHSFCYQAPDRIEPIAQELKEFLEQVADSCAKGRRQTVDIVAHSLGGLVARHCLQELGGARLVDQCITLATPHYGSFATAWASTSIGHALHPESDFIVGLNQESRRAQGVRYHSLWAEQDIMVLPRENAIYLEGDDACVEGVGHMGILLHPAGLKLLAAKLAAGQGLPGSRVEWVGSAGGGVLKRILQRE